MQKINREDVVQAALIVERWCAAQECDDCPFNPGELMCQIRGMPFEWKLEIYLRTRGLKHD